MSGAAAMIGSEKGGAVVPICSQFLRSLTENLRGKAFNFGIYEAGDDAVTTNGPVLAGTGNSRAFALVRLS